jgi:uncharacterized membrane protein YdjX (TVP38/TMEM64 family)
MKERGTRQRSAAGIKWAAIGVTALALSLIARSLPLEHAVPALRAWIDGLGAWGPVAFGLLYAAATLLFIPALGLTLATGALFGVWPGVMLVSLASTTGAALAFLIARYVAREQVAFLMRGRPKLTAVETIMREGGWRLVALLRLSLALPFSLENYLLGLTAIGFWPYLITSWLAMLPGTVVYVYIGHVTGALVSGTRDRTAAEWVALGVGLAATVAALVYLAYLAKKALQQQADRGRQADGAPAAEQERSEEPGPKASPWPLQ